MNMIKTRTLPLLTGLLAASVMPLAAQVRFSLSSRIEYRQNKAEIKFRGGSFAVDFTDGSVFTYPVCNSSFYYEPGFFRGLCSPGSTGFVTSGSINGATFLRPYLLVTSLSPSIVVEPFKEQLVSLVAAPASTLPRPSGGFKDDSVSVNYNLTTNEIEEFRITRYFLTKNYDKRDRTKFQSEIVPGVYQYVFPALNRLGGDYLFQPAPIKADVFPMVEGFAKVNNTDQGVRFTSINNNKWSKDGYIELSYLRPNVIKWEGFDPTTVFAGVDNLYFSLKALLNPKNPENSALDQSESVFPAFDNDRESRVLLRNTYQQSFTIPPIFPSGTRAMAELHLQRDFQTGPVTFDYSSRKFQVPVKVVNRFTDYTELNLAKSKQKELLADPDGDGFNNMTEWILGSSGSDRNSIPEAPVPAAYTTEDAYDEFFFYFGYYESYFGFNVPIQNETVPKVKYILQRSLDQGKTWQEFKEGYYLEDGSFTTVPLVDYSFPGFPIILAPHNWGVRKVTSIVRGITYTRFEVRSGIINPTITDDLYTIQPPGTIGDLYRVKIVLPKRRSK